VRPPLCLVGRVSVVAVLSGVPVNFHAKSSKSPSKTGC
jgi:hypothetical protein